MFFVLSGFLITRILMEERVKAAQTGASRLVVFKNFFFRRALRIFPIYYLLIFVLWCINGYAGTNIEAHIGYFLSYTSNFYFYRLQSWDGVLSHTWSLAIEEQFYLVWPWLILFINRKYLVWLIGCCIAIGVIGLYAVRSEFGEVLPHTCLGAFGMGALLSWVVVFRPAVLPAVYKVLAALSVVAAVILVMQVIMARWDIVPVRTLVSVLTGWLIALILYKRGNIAGPLSMVLTNRGLIFLGKISYGIYLFHPIIPHYTKDILERMNRHIPVLGSHLLFFEQCTLAVLTAWLSWRLIEQPILGLKKYFVLSRKAVRPQAAIQEEAAVATSVLN
jgi:peptidoglycan/LPS O-acetylase OafA/YrhL